MSPHSQDRRFATQALCATRCGLLFLVLAFSAGVPADSIAQEPAQPEAPSPLSVLTGSRWVGIVSDAPTIGLWLEFYPDTMLVMKVGSGALRTWALNYRATDDSLIAIGDTTLRASYEVVLGRVLLYTSTGYVITMSSQDRQARTFVGSWAGLLESEDGESRRAQLRIYANGTATWRPLGDNQIVGEWDRDGRRFTFTWLPDSTQWVGLYDAEGNAMQFPNTGEGTIGTVFRKAFR